METETVVYFKPGEVIFKQGDLGDCMYFIREGTAVVEVENFYKDDEGEEATVVVANLRPGDPAGELALVLPGGKRTATVRAISLVVAEKTTKEQFDAMLKNAHPTLQEIVQALVRKLVDTTQKYATK